MTLIISAFPGTGKTYLTQNRSDLTIWDSDSSNFSKSPEFPQNYVDYIKLGIKLEKDVILVSSHKVVRDALTANGIQFITIVPPIEAKEEYSQRYRDRGSAESFIDLISNNWADWLKETYSQPGSYVLFAGEYLSDIIDQLLSLQTPTKNVE